MPIIASVTLILVALIGAVGTVWAARIRAKVAEIHVLVNSNLTAVTEALARKTAQNTALESENATLRGEPASTAQIPPPAP